MFGNQPIIALQDDECLHCVLKELMHTFVGRGKSKQEILHSLAWCSGEVLADFDDPKERLEVANRNQAEVITRTAYILSCRSAMKAQEGKPFN